MIKAAVVGCGTIAHEHFAFLSADPRVDLAAVCDRSPVTARYAAQRYGARRTFSDFAELLAEVKPDVVHVLTPPSTHMALASAALAAGSHVVVEKPIAPSRAGAQVVLDRAAEAGRHVIESQNLRFNDEVLAIEHLWCDGSLGAVANVEVTYCLDVASGRFASPFANPTAGLAAGAVHDFLPHLAYLALHFFDYAEIDRTAAFWRNRSGNPHVGFDELNAMATIGDGVAIVRFLAQVQPPGLRVVVRGSRASAEAELFHPAVCVESVRAPAALSGSLNHARNGLRLARASVANVVEKVMQKTIYHGLLSMLADFYGAVESGRAPAISAEQILRSSELIDRLIADLPS